MAFNELEKLFSQLMRAYGRIDDIKNLITKTVECNNVEPKRIFEDLQQLQKFLQYKVNLFDDITKNYDKVLSLNDIDGSIEYLKTYVKLYSQDYLGNINLLCSHEIDGLYKTYGDTVLNIGKIIEFKIWLKEEKESIR